MRKWLQRILVLLVLLILVGSMAGIGGFSYLIRRSDSAIDGTVVVEGVSQPVEIIRDTYGIPHIFAQNRVDLAFAFGYAEAQDRLWQIDLLRHFGKGRLSELFGANPEVLNVDLLLRTAVYRPDQEEFLRQAWQTLVPEVRNELDAFARGVNAFVALHPGKLPLEFFILSHAFEPFEAMDCAWMLFPMHWGLGMNVADEVLATKIAAKLDPALLLELFPEAPETILPGEAGQTRTVSKIKKARTRSGNLASLDSGIRHSQYTPVFSGLSSDTLSRLGPELTLFPLHLPGVRSGTPVSNGWVVGGARTPTGKPLFVSDPHLPTTLPSTWYEVHLVAPGVDVIGAAYPGLPYVVVGHNRHIAWGTTNAMADNSDLFIERLNPNNPKQAWFQGQWEEMQVEEIAIAVKGQAPEIREIRSTRHGPIITPLFPGLKETLALHWMGVQEGLAYNSIEGFRFINMATNWEEFRAATRKFSTMALNLMYADVDGNIGWQMTGKVPIRAKGDGRFPVPGWTGEHEWTGFVPFEENPSYLLPPGGADPQVTGSPVSSVPTHVVATSNQRTVRADYPYHLSNSWVPPYRFLRISQLLGHKEKISVEDAQQYQADQHSLFADTLVPLICEIPMEAEETDDLRWAVQTLCEWDRQVTKDSSAATLYELIFFHLMKNAYSDDLGDLYEDYAERFGTFLYSGIDRLIQQPEAQTRWWDDVQTPVIETRTDILRHSVQDAVTDARQRLGTDASGWQWERLHQAVFVHPLGQVWPLDWLLNRSVAHGGDGHTVNLGHYSFKQPFNATAAATYRMIVDMADVTQAQSMNAIGQSGRPFTPHYDDMLQPWAEVEYHPMWMEKTEIVEHSEGTLVLTSKGSSDVQIQ